MKNRHRAALPPWHEPRPVILDEAYARQVERSTERLQRDYARAEKRLRQAQERLDRARTSPRHNVKRQLLAQLEAVLETRREELEEYRRMMTSSPAGSEHRGTSSFRPVPYRDAGI